MPEGRIYYGFFTLVGIGIIAFTIFFSLQSINALHWAETQATLISQKDQTLSYSYSVRGEQYRSQKKLDALYAPKTTTVYYNPSNPRQNTTSKGLTPIAIISILFGGVIAFFSFTQAVYTEPGTIWRSRYAGAQGINPDH